MANENLVARATSALDSDTFRFYRVIAVPLNAESPSSASLSFFFLVQSPPNHQSTQFSPPEPPSNAFHRLSDANLLDSPRLGGKEMEIRLTKS